MKLVNNRYKVIQSMGKNKLVSSYLVSDIWNENKKVQLNILNSEFISKSLIDFYVKEFLFLKNLNCQNIAGNYGFNAISYIDNKKNSEKSYYFTCEYVGNPQGLLEGAKHLDSFQLMDMFIDICKGVNYLHLKGIIHGLLNLNMIMVVENEDAQKVMLKDMAMVQLEKYNPFSSIEDYSCFVAPRILAGENPDIESDMYSLGIILLLLLRKQHQTIDPMNDLELLRSTAASYGQAEVQFIDSLIPIIRKLLTAKGPYPYSSLHDFILELNSALNKNYSIVNREEIERLNFHTKLIGREDEITNIIANYQEIKAYRPRKKIFLLKGDTGTGKTRFLEEVESLIKLKKGNVYSSYSLNSAHDSSNKIWIELFQKVILECNSQILEKYERELIKYFPQKNSRQATEGFNGSNTKLRLLNRIAGFLADLVKDKPAVFIIDNINLANEFTIEALTYLSTEFMDNNSLMFIFSYNESEARHTQMFMDLIERVENRSDCEVLTINNLNSEQTGMLIKSILAIPFIPFKLTGRIYPQSFGNPLFINEIMKDLFIRKVIFVHTETGRWQIDLPEEGKYNLLELPINIKQALLNQLIDLDEESLEVLQWISVFLSPVPLSFLEYSGELSVEKMKLSLNKLIEKGILNQLQDLGSFEFRNKALQNIVYSKIEPSEKSNKHALAANLLEKDMAVLKRTDLKELIYHFEKASMKEKVYKYCLLNAQWMKSLKKTKEAIKSLKKCLLFTETNLEKINLLIEIGILYYDSSEVEQALEFYQQAEKLAEIFGDEESQMKVYINMAEAYSFQFLEEQTLEYLQKVEKQINNPDYLELKFEYKRIHALVLTDNNFLQEASEICLEILADCGDHLSKIKGKTNMLLGYIYSNQNRMDEAVELYEKAIKLYEKAEFPRGVLVATNNIGAMYNEAGEVDKALEYFLKVKELSKEYGFLYSELLGYINISDIYIKKFDYEAAYEQAILALEKAKKGKFHNQVFYLYATLNRICLLSGRFHEAYQFYLLCEKGLEEFPNQGMDLVEFHKTYAGFNYLFGDFKKAQSYYQKSIEFYQKNGENLAKLDCIIFSLLIDLKTKDDGQVHSIFEELQATISQVPTADRKITYFTQSAVALSSRERGSLAEMMIAEAEKLLTRTNCHDELKANYYYALGMTKKGKDNYKVALQLAEGCKNKELIAKLTMALGDYYYGIKEYHLAANYYLECAAALKQLIHRLPDQYQLKFLNRHQFGKCFYRLIKINSYLASRENNPNLHNEDVIYIKSSEELQKLLKIDFVNDFRKYKDFVQAISEEYMNELSDGTISEMDLITNLTNDTFRNINMIVKYLTAQMIATRGLLILEGNQVLSVLASTNDNYNLPGGMYVFQRVRSLMEPILISRGDFKKPTEHHFLAQDMRASLCIPIKGKSLDKSILLGYLYLETDRIINNFNEEGLRKCAEFTNFLALLIEKHHLELSASIDKLTGALTRKYLEESLANVFETSSRNNEPFSVIMYDLDKFKSVNDRFGHQTGDEVLKNVTRIIKGHIRKKDILGRYGGEEFTIILPGMKQDQALEVAEAIREKIQAQKILGNKAAITISMGIATFPNHDIQISGLIDKADQALYMAKESGRNRCQIWEEKFLHKAKPNKAVNGIITGDEVKDSRNMLSLIELIQLTNNNLSKEDNIYQFLGRITEMLEAENSLLFIVREGAITETFARRTKEEEWIKHFSYNANIVSTVIENGQGLFIIDWEDDRETNMKGHLPDWNSILAIPLKVKGEVVGVIYLSAPARTKEFGLRDLTMMKVIGDLAASIIS